MPHQNDQTCNPHRHRNEEVGNKKWQAFHRPEKAEDRNKRTYNKTTGVMTFYADDGFTPLFTATFSEAASVVTRGELAAP